MSSSSLLSLSLSLSLSLAMRTRLRRISPHFPPCDCRLPPLTASARPPSPRYMRRVRISRIDEQHLSVPVHLLVRRCGCCCHLVSRGVWGGRVRSMRRGRVRSVEATTYFAPSHIYPRTAKPPPIML
ncbi:uncharacterized protein IWZ02DRAFT_313957 [Phyllosticta citriasiana]|uniref:uncharacterized protein n=1 Tax=Phyllosticta citriasiana TaxID=595635 RepID=UPI0030FD7FCC